MTKEEKIKEAWGSLWTSFEKHIDNDGWIDAAWIEDTEIELDVKDGFDRYGTSSTFIRHVSLKGIENNNGWIKIESEDDLPKEELDVHFIFTEFKGKEGLFQTFGVWDNKLKSFYSGALKIKTVTHYQPIEKPKPPLY